jgi:WhiB family redox-sensing transcriptional regulator
LKDIVDTKYFALLKAIHASGGVPCEPYPQVMYPEDIGEPELRAATTKVAKALCQSCPIIEECFTYAIETNQRYGVWGGTLPHER